MRRLDTVRRMLLTGSPLAEAAAAAGFADQSHMTRHFSKTFGFDARALAAGRRERPARLKSAQTFNTAAKEHA